MKITGDYTKLRYFVQLISFCKLASFAAPESASPASKAEYKTDYLLIFVIISNINSKFLKILTKITIKAI
jgi:hypothetical protein